MDIRQIGPFLFILYTFLCSTAYGLAPLHGFIASENEVTHVEISRALPYSYKFKEVSPHVFELRLPELSAQSRSEWLKFKDDHVESIEAKPSDISGEWLITFKVKPEVDGFDYLTDDPGRLIIDFYKKEKEGAATTFPKTEIINKEGRSSKKTASSDQSKSSQDSEGEKKSTALSRKSKDRAPASSELLKIAQADDHEEIGEVRSVKGDKEQKRSATQENESEFEIKGLYDGGDPDYKRFTIQDFEIDPIAVVASRQNLYLPFPLIEYDNQPLRDIEKYPPRYEIKALPTKENKLSRLMIQLFNEKKTASFAKALSEFRKIFPDSKYEEVLKYMEADLLYTKWKTEPTPENFDIALNAYKFLATQYPKSALNKRTQLLILYSQIDRGFYVGAIRSAESALAQFAGQPEEADIKIALAHSLMQMKKYEDAQKTLDEVVQGKYTLEKRAYAALYKGNVAFKSKQLDAAVEFYQTAYKNFPEARKTNGLGLYNLGETLFWLERRKESLEYLREYLQKFPNPEFGGFALTRIGEVLESLGAPQSRSIGALKECMFRFAGTGGAKVAEIKTLTRRMKDMKSKELESSIAQIEKLEKDLKIPEVPSYVNFLMTQGYAERGEFEKATQGLIDYYQNHPKVDTRDFYSKNIAKHITSEIVQKTENRENFEALRKFNRYSSSWLKGNMRLDTLYYAGVSYEKIGSGERALENYEKVQEGLLLSQKDEKLKESRLIEKLPTMDQLQLRIAAANAQLGRYNQAALAIDQIQKSEELDHIEQIEESLLSAKIEESKGEETKAVARVKKLISLWKESPTLLPPAHLRLGQLYQKLKKYPESIEAYQQTLATTEDVKTKSKALDGLAKVFESNGDYKNSIATLKDYISLNEKDEDVSEAKYRLGTLLFKQKQYDLAKESWQSIADKKTVWAKLAQDRLKETEWNKEYDRYVDRIPAMQNAATGKTQAQDSQPQNSQSQKEQ